MSGSAPKLIAGLGNPGREYSQTRHNIGFQVVEVLARNARADLDKKRFDAVYAKTRISGQTVFLTRPMSYMNRSGFPLQKLASYFKIPVQDIIVIHDDMDLEFGKIKIVKSRGHGGHNGVRSIIEAFGSRDFVRVRVGLGRPLRSDGGRPGVTGYVLGKFSPREKEILDTTIEDAVQACILILEKGVTRAMNLVNSKDPS
ncbi:aminoacyl-tRNA hydrolase [Desulfospira joergensenii]|uniref:aminoacyl-tRNA hydrolase n=1 Tax=Desulfospira joergensenii TaxID=53329 RepID=UPI0003B4F70A|nr:aminoacyl-tRNA hydrolase [Desulfospira joergensenii]